MSSPLRRDLAELMRLALPVVGSRLGVMAMGLTDTVVVGRYSAKELGYMALGLTPTAVIMVAAMGLLTGVQVMTARRVGEGRLDEAGFVLRRGLSYGFLTSLAASVALLALGPAFLHAVGVGRDLADGASRVLAVFACSTVTAVVGVVCSSWLEAQGRPGEAMLAMWSANGVNLALDLLLVPGRAGLPALGAAGAGWSTFAARALMLAVLCAFIARTPAGRRALLHKPPRDPPAEIEQRRIGYAAGIAFFVEAGAFSAMNIVAGWVGGLAVAGWAIVLNVSSIIFMFPLGVATATSVLVARAYGAEDAGAMRRAGLLGFGVAALVAAVVSLAVWPGAGLIAGAYATDAALVALVRAALALACLFFIADALQVVGAQALRACGDIWLSTAVQVASYALVMLPLGWALALPARLGLSGIVWAVVVASLMSSGLLITRFARVAQG
jgi:MATE family multidrug resistance protein